MGIRVICPNCNKQLNVKSFLAGKRGVCPECRTKFEIPAGAEHKVVLEVEDPGFPAGPLYGDGLLAALPSQAPAAPQVEPAPQTAPAAYTGPAPPTGYVLPAAGHAGGTTMAGMPTGIPVAMSVAAPLAAAPSDPIAQAPHATWHICTVTGEKYGPVLGQVLRQWISERRLAADSLVWRDGWDQWQRADQVFAELSAVPPVAIMAAPIVPGAESMPAMFPVAESPGPGEVFSTEPMRLKTGRTYGRRSNNKNLRAVVLALLILAVLILAPLLGYVLMRQF